MGIGGEDHGNFITHSAEDGHLLLFAALRMCWIIEWIVVAIQLAGKNRAYLVRIAADGDDGFDFAGQKEIEVFGLVRGDIDPDFRHGLDREWMHVARWLGSGRGNFNAGAECFLENAFGEVRAAGIAGAENENHEIGVGNCSVQSV